MQKKVCNVKNAFWLLKAPPKCWGGAIMGVSCSPSLQGLVTALHTDKPRRRSKVSLAMVSNGNLNN